MRLQKLLTCIFIFLLGTFLYGESSIPKVEYKKVKLNSLEDINTWKNSNELYVFTNVIYFQLLMLLMQK